MKKRILLSFLVFILICFASINISYAQDTNYFRSITISSEQNYTDAQINIILNTAELISAGKMRSDCGDIRFYDSDWSMLQYFIEPMTCNSSNTSIWVLVPQIPVGNKTIYMSYGNFSNTSLSNSSIFLAYMYDNFSALTSFWGYRGFINGGTYSINSSQYVSPSSSLKFYRSSTTTVGYIWVGTNYIYTPNANEKVLFKAWVKNFASSSDRRAMLFLYNYTDNPSTSTMDSDLPIKVIDNVDYIKCTIYGTYVVINQNVTQVWRHLTIEWIYPNIYKLYYNNTLCLQRTTSYTTVSIALAGVGYTVDQYWDDFQMIKVKNVIVNITIGNESADLIVKNITVSEAVYGYETTITATIENNGGTNAKNFNVSFLVDGELLTKVQIPLLLPFSSTTVNVSWMPTKVGETNITVIVDSDNSVLEDKENNNANSIIVDVKYIDLTAFLIVPSTPSRIINLVAIITNSGTADASAFYVSIFVNEKLINETLISSLPAGVNTVLTIQQVFAEARNYTITVIVDVDGDIIELNEDNNIIVISVTIQPPPTPSEYKPSEPSGYVRRVVEHGLGLDFSAILTFFLVLAGLLFFAGGIQTGAIGLAFMTLVNLVVQISAGLGFFIPVMAFLSSIVIWILIVVFSGEERW